LSNLTELYQNCEYPYAIIPDKALFTGII